MCAHVAEACIVSISAKINNIITFVETVLFYHGNSSSLVTFLTMYMYTFDQMFEIIINSAREPYKINRILLPNVTDQK